MNDPWMDRFSEYVDGELGADEAQSLERHLCSCAECRDTVSQLRAVVGAAHSLTDREPPRDLWAGIAAGLDAAPREADGDAGVVPFRAPAPTQRRFSFSAPQLAAAAMILVAVSAGSAWLLTGAGGFGGAGTGAVAYEQGAIFQSAGSAPDEIRLTGTTPGAQPAPDAPSSRDAAEVEEVLSAARESLDAATVEVLERSLESISAALADAHAALDADPGNPYLQRQLDSTLQRREDVLRRVSRVQRGGT
jgi:DNA-binding FrmR family transcriptional regulator